jgi:hypothetical protein
MVAEITTAITSAFTQLLTGVGTAIVGLFDKLVYPEVSAGVHELTVFAKWGFVMLGLSLAIGLIIGTVRRIG